MRYIAAILLSFFFVLPALAQRPSVLLIESYHADYAWALSYKKGIRGRFGDSVELYNFQMNTKRIPRNTFQQKADEAFAFYKKIQPNIVMLADDNAATLLGHRLAEEPVYIVYFGITGNPRKYNLYGQENAAGVLERPLVKRSIHMLSTLMPNTQRILVLLDESTTSHEILSDLLVNKRSFVAHGIHCNIELAATYKDWQNHVQTAAAKGYDAILIGTYHTLQDTNGKVVHEDTVMKWFNQNSPVPPFALWDFSIGKGKTAGGFVLRGEDQGSVAAELAQRFLTGGELPASPVTILPSLLLNKYEMDRWNITPPPEMLKRIIWKE